MNLHPRNTCTHDAERREKAKAHRILDRYRAGDPTTQGQINWALRMTGDLTADMPDDEAAVETDKPINRSAKQSVTHAL